MSPRCPLRHALTKRTGTTCWDFLLWSTNLPFDREDRGINRRERVERPDSVARAPWVMNHSGNCQQVIPVFWVEVGSSSSGGGACSARPGIWSNSLSLAASRGSEISSPFVQYSRPPTMTEWLGRSNIEPGPNVVTTWL